MTSNIEIIQAAYAAFGRGDLPGILAQFAPDVAWEVVGKREHFPTFGTWSGHAGATEFFTQLGANEQFSLFDPHTLAADGHKVFVEGRCESVITKSGRAIAYDFFHIFTLSGGKVVAFKEFLDSGTIAEAYAA